MKAYTYGFIGAGNMGGAIAKAVSLAVPKENIAIADYDAAKAEALVANIGGEVRDNEYIAANCDFVFLGVKPQVMENMLAGIKNILASRGDGVVLVSMAAGLSIDDIQRMAGAKCPVIRIMPNMPVAVGEGMILYSLSANVDVDRAEAFKSAMRFAGAIDMLPESYIDVGSALSGCGPAFVYMFIEALADGAVKCGLPRDKAIAYAAQTLSGAAKMVSSTGEHPGKLKDAVCSPGGSTIAGVEALESGAFRGTVMNAIEAAYIRTKELGKK